MHVESHKTCSFLFAHPTKNHNSAKMLRFSASQVLQKGLELYGIELHCQRKSCRASNVRKFKKFYGSTPEVYKQIFHDLQTTEIDKARVDPEDICLDSFLMAINFLKLYETETVRAAIFDICENTARKWAWFYVKKIQALKKEKIIWPKEWNRSAHDAPIFIISVDGVHCKVYEPKHPLYSKNKACYSHKFKQAGLTYELALSVYLNRLVWMRGPGKASKHDITVFREKLLKKIPPGKRVIGDNGYRGEKEKVSTPNRHDSPELRKFKSRARSRQEAFNSRIKSFGCLSETFRHGVKKHRRCFEAVCVIAQHQLEFGSPLFDV